MYYNELLMDYQIASKKLIAAFVLFSVIMSVTAFVYSSLFNGQTVTVCSSGQRLAVVFHLANDATILIPTSSLKNTLDCLRRGMSFYDRDLELVVTAGMSEDYMLNLRSSYTIKQETDRLRLNTGLQIITNGNVLTVKTNKLQAFFLKEITDPYTFVEYLRQINPEIVVVPQFTEVISKLLSDIFISDVIRSIELKEGNFITLHL